MRTPFNKAISLIICFCLISSGCASSGKNSKYTGQQKQQLETNVVESSYNNAFNATRTVFLNSGLVLQQVDKDSGFLRGSTSVKNKQSKWRFGLILLGILGILIYLVTRDSSLRECDITATLVDIGNNSVEIRLQTPMLEEQSENYGMVLKQIFAEIKKQALILEAAGRT